MTPTQPARTSILTVAESDQPSTALFPWRVEPSIRRLPPEFYTVLNPECVGQEPLLVHASTDAAALLDIDAAAFSTPAFARIFSGHLQIAGFEPLATVYAGHQFGTYVPRLGDGRALLIAQVRNSAGALWDVQLKGAGHTPYSRSGDGRAVMRSSLREYLCSEAMAALGIPTTRALAVVATGETVYRETPEPGAILTRLAPSHIRFGHFEYFHHSGRPDLVRLLADHVIDEHFPDLANRPTRHRDWFQEIVRRTARLMAHWQAAGFAHGVMNTDNMSILGLTIDYGPFGFLDAYDPQFICNHSDHTGRYAFDQQPSIGLWNLQALALALTSLIETEALKEALATYAPVFFDHFGLLMRNKLGLGSDAPHAQTNSQLIDDLLDVMAQGAADYTLTFRNLSHAAGSEGRAAWIALFGASAQNAAAAWLERYNAHTLANAPKSPEERQAAMDKVNPKYVLRNWVAETVIRAVEDQGDLSAIDRVMTLLQAPFSEHTDAEAFAAPPPASMCHLSVSCSS